MSVTAAAIPEAIQTDRRKGVYLLLLEARQVIPVGRLGLVTFDGWYVYVGSALGPGGLCRVARHFSYAERSQRRARWHIDNVLGQGGLKGAIVAATEQRLECALAERGGGRLASAFRGFGSSDCRCTTHLAVARTEEQALAAGMWAIRGLGLEPEIISSGEV